MMTADDARAIKSRYETDGQLGNRVILRIEGLIVKAALAGHTYVDNIFHHFVLIDTPTLDFILTHLTQSGFGLIQRRDTKKNHNPDYRLTWK